jgi:hypothetical protein
MPAHLFASEQSMPQAEADGGRPIRDAALGSGGLLVGRLLDAQGQSLPAAPVAILSDQQVIAETMTDANGAFAVAGLRGGVHQIQAGNTVQLYRLWAPGTEPPGAERFAQLVSGPDVVRGNWDGHGGIHQRAIQFASNPFVIGGVIAAAIAIPIIVHAESDSSPHS